MQKTCKFKKYINIEILNSRNMYFIVNKVSASVYESVIDVEKILITRYPRLKFLTK